MIDQLDRGPVHLVGHDWGAAIAYNAAAKAPQDFKSLTTMAVPHAGRFARDGLRIPRQLKMSWYMGFFNLPWVSDWAVRRRDYAFIRNLWRNWSPGWSPEPAVIESVVDTLSQPGVLSAALGYYRAALSLSALLASPDAAMPVYLKITSQQCFDALGVRPTIDDVMRACDDNTPAQQRLGWAAVLGDYVLCLQKGRLLSFAKRHGLKGP